MIKSGFKFNKWLWLGILVEVIVAPNQAIMKQALNGVNFAYFSFLRYALVFIICVPALVRLFRSNSKKEGVGYSIVAGLLLAVAVLCHTYALRIVDASYASILALSSPLFLIPFSVKLEGDRINSRLIAGLSISAAGAFMVIFMPIAFKNKGDFNFDFVATLLLIIAVISGALYTVLSRKANEAGLKIDAIFSITAVIGLIAYFAVFAISVKGDIYPHLALTYQQIMAVIFSAIIVMYFARKWTLLVYEKSGPVILSGLGYLGVFLSVLFSIISLNEKPPVGVIVGGVLIILGLYISDYHKSEHHKHSGDLKHH
jgi:drug/metabolite transporter (DMT)-like permease